MGKKKTHKGRKRTFKYKWSKFGTFRDIVNFGISKTCIVYLDNIIYYFEREKKGWERNAQSFGMLLKINLLRKKTYKKIMKAIFD